jgi:hypothetical protein
MSDPFHAPHPAVPEPAMSAEQRRTKVLQTLEHRFRHHLRTGHVSPLLHLVMRFQLEKLT